MIIAFVLLPASEVAGRTEMVSIAGEWVNYRTGPGEHYRIKSEVGRGFPLQVLKKKGQWYRVKDFEGDIGWVHSSLTSSTPHMVVKYKKRRVNIRSGPGEKYRLVGKAIYGVVFMTLEQKNGWVKVKHEKGLTGWVNRKLLWGW